MIVATLLEARLDAIQAAIIECDATADAFEIRFDALQEQTDPGDIRNLTKKPLIATLRQPAEGGLRESVAEERTALFRACAEVGFDFLDLEPAEQAPTTPDRIIRSQHDLRATPASATLVRLAGQVARESVFKFAAKIRSFSDTLQILAASRTLQREGRPFALMGMGEFPRALTHLMGARLVYGGGRSNAPGQPGHAQVAATLRHWGSPGPATSLMLVVGDPIEHSLSPRMHNAALAHAKIDASYGALRVTNHTELQMLIEKADALRLTGLSVTTPLKDAAYELCGARMPEAEAARAVNCIQVRDGVAIGHNTDGLAAAAIARSLVNDDGRLLIIGTGGAARALAAQWPARHLTVAGRSPETVRQVSRERGCKGVPLGLVAEEIGEADLIVNANRELQPVALQGYTGALFDFHYGPEPTPWQEFAKGHGLAFAGGRRLLLEQGLLAFRIWTGQDPPTRVMQDAIGADA